MEDEIKEVIFVVENEHLANKEYRKSIEDAVKNAMGWVDVIIQPMPRKLGDSICNWTRFCMRPVLTQPQRQSKPNTQAQEQSYDHHPKG